MPRKTAAARHQARRSRRPQALHRADPIAVGTHDAGFAPPTRGRCEGARARIAYEAARMLAEQGESEFDRARRKAAARSGVGDRRCWPDNSEIEAALQRHYRLFHAEAQDRVTTALRRQALSAMGLFAAFEPRLVGPAVTGLATRNDGLQLHVFADDPSALLFLLLDRGISFQERDGQFRYTGGISQSHPMLRFMAGEVPVELIVLPLGARRNPPLSAVTERPERGLRADELARLLEETADGGQAGSP